MNQQAPFPTLNIGYIFYKLYYFVKDIHLFLISFPWSSVIHWIKLIGLIAVIIFAAGIIYNLVRINLLLKTKSDQ